MPVVLLLIVIFCAGVVAASIYNRRQKAGKNPWVLAIIAFILTASVLTFGVFALILLAFGFER